MSAKQELLFIDIETYSSIDLRKANVYRYAESPDFEILIAAWATEDREVKLAVGHDEIKRIPGLWDASVTKVAHNAQFERVCFSALYGMVPGSYFSPAAFEDTMALAGVWGYPQSLKYLAEALGAEEKDEAGTRLINLFSKPNPKTGKRRDPAERPEDWKAYCDYCVQDVATLIDVYDRILETHLGWPSDSERRLFWEDQRINDRGIAVDLDMVHDAIGAAEENRERMIAEAKELTGVENPNSPAQLLEWFERMEHPLPDLRADTVKAALAEDGLDPDVERMLQLRKDLALSAAKKYDAALGNTSRDGRLRGSFRYFGAHTGRWAGRGVQLQNLPSATLAEDTPEEPEANLTAMTEVRENLEMGLPVTATELKAVVRQMFTGPFTVVDFAAIEARVLAWLAGETWALEAFAAGRDIYVETAARMFDLDEEAARKRRKEGKVAVLALGYNGGVGSLEAMGATGTTEHKRGLVNAWRSANEEIAGFWPALEEAFKRGNGAQVGPTGLRVQSDGRDRMIELPSGRSMVYHGCKMMLVPKKDPRTGETTKRKAITFVDPKKRGARSDTYGGRLTENVTQAVARDILGEAVLNLARRGHKIVGHVHDEILVEGANENSVALIEGTMTRVPSWASGLPLAAAGFTTDRYRKD